LEQPQQQPRQANGLLAQRAADLGGIAAARGMETYVLFWLTLWGALGTPDFNIRIVGA